MHSQGQFLAISNFNHVEPAAISLMILYLYFHYTNKKKQSFE